MNDLTAGIKQETPEERCPDVKVEAYDLNFDEHLAVKREEECSEFGYPVPFSEPESHSENAGGLREIKEDSDESLKCHKCAYQADSPSRLREHVSSHSDEQLLDCPHCNYKGRQKSYLLLHLKRSHPDKLPHACDSCSYRSSDPSSLEKHRKMHKQKPMKCKVCTDFVTTSLIEMRSHKQLLHRRKCPDCDYTSLQTNKLKQHMLMHETEKTLSCTHCNYKTVFQYDLNKHVAHKHRVENADYKKYKCPHCPYKTDQPINYRSHLCRHTGERPFSCDQCDYKTTRKHTLMIHILYKHSNERPFKCAVCQKDFKRQSDLQIHLSLHSNKKEPMQCDECEFSSLYKSNLKTHKRLKHCKPFACTICCYKDECDDDLKKHVSHSSCTLHAPTECPE